MTPTDRTPAYLWDMINAIDQLQTGLQGKTYEDYQTELLLQRGVERLLEILGEAARRIDRSFHDQHPEVEWADIIGLRNVISHQYDELDLEQLWDILQNRLSPLRQKLQTLLEQMEPPT